MLQRIVEYLDSVVVVVRYVNISLSRDSEASRLVELSALTIFREEVQ